MNSKWKITAIIFVFIIGVCLIFLRIENINISEIVPKLEALINGNRQNNSTEGQMNNVVDSKESSYESGLSQALGNYDYISDFQKGLAIVQKNRKCGLIDKTGKEVIPCIYDNVYNSSEDLAAIQKNSKWGFIDKTGNEVIPCIYDDVDYNGFQEGFIWVKKDGKNGCIDKTGKEVISFIYDSYDHFKDGVALVYKDNNWSIIDKTGKVVTSLIYERYQVQNFQEGLAQVAKNEKCGFIDKTGKEIIPCIYVIQDCECEYGFSEGLARVQKDDSTSLFIDRTGKEVISLPKNYFFSLSENFHENLALIATDCTVNGMMHNKYGFIDKTGNIVIPYTYDRAWSFHEGLAAVEKNGKLGFIDKTGKEVIPCVFDQCEEICNFYFSDGLAKVILNGQDGFVDKDGYFIGKGFVKKISELNNTSLGNISSTSQTTNTSSNQNKVFRKGFNIESYLSKNTFVSTFGNSLGYENGDRILRYNASEKAIYINNKIFGTIKGNVFLTAVNDNGDITNYFFIVIRTDSHETVMFTVFPDNIILTNDDNKKAVYYGLEGDDKSAPSSNSDNNSSSYSDNSSSSSNNGDSYSNSQILSSQASMFAYLDGRTFVADDGKKFKFHAPTEVYMNGMLFGYASEWYGIKTNSNNGRNYVPFKVVVPYNQQEILFAFYPPDIIRDQEGRNYYLK